MNCPNCQTEVPGDSAFCHSCGAPVAPAGPPVPQRRPSSRRAWPLAAGAGALAFVAAGVVVVLLVVQPFGGDDGEEEGSAEFALEYVLRAMDFDEAWLRDRTISGYFDFSAPWFQRLQGCKSAAIREAAVDSNETSPVQVVSVVFDPPCEPRPSIVEVGITFTIEFQDASVTSADVQQALVDLSHEEAQVLTTSDGAFIIRTAELEGLPGPPIGPAPPSERDIIEQALRDSLGDFQVLNFSQFASAGDTGSYACVLLRVEDNVESKATITRWSTDEAGCSPDSPNFAAGFGDPSLGPAYVLIEADVPPGTDVDAAMEGVAELLLRRADSFGAPAELRREGSNRLSAVLQGIDPAEARALLGKTALLEFRKPVLEEGTRNIVCRTLDGGTTYALSFGSGAFLPDRDNNRMSCPHNEEGEAGFVQWEPATGIDSQGVERPLTGAYLRPNARVVGPPIQVALEFNREGGQIFEQVTEEVVGLPLAIFLDEDLISAPTVQQAISGGQSTITGLDVGEARMLAIQLNAGVLPVLVRTIQETRLASQGLPFGTPVAIRSLRPSDGKTTPTSLLTPGETPTDLITFQVPERTIDSSKSHNAVIKTDKGDIVIALSPDAPQAANSFAFLVGNGFYDGLEFFWVMPGFSVQAGDPTCESSRAYSCTGTGGPGYTLLREGDTSKARRWSVIAPIIPAESDQVHGSQFFIALTDGRLEGSVFAVVVEGQEILQSLEQRIPCFGAEPSNSNPCQNEEELPSPLIIEDVVIVAQ